MNEKSYQIVVTGELASGSHFPDVKAKLSALFGTTAEKLGPLFSGKRVVIKKGLDKDAALKYVAAVQEAGLLCVAETIPAAPPMSTAVPLTEVSIAPVGTMLVDPLSVAPPQIDVSAFTVAPVGETLIDVPAVPTPQISTGSFVLAPRGGNLVEHISSVAPTIDISALSVAELGSLLTESKAVVPRTIDTGNLGVAPLGSEMGEKKREHAPPPLNISHLELD